MTKSKIFFVLSLSFLCGVFAASFFQPGADNMKSVLWLLSAGAIAISVLNHGNKTAAVISIAVLFFAAGAWRTSSTFAAAKNNLASQKLGPAEFSALVVKEPESDEKNQKLIVEDGEKNRILINAGIFPSYYYGDELGISCALQKPENFSEKFDYQMYLAKDGIFRICDKPQISIVARNRGNKLYSSVLAVKNGFEEKLSRIFPDPEGAYLKGLLLGGSRRMTKELADAFSRTGTSHTLAVSGYNVTIVAAFLMWAGIWIGLWRQQVFAFAVAGIVLFVLATGAPSSAVRAGIMGSLVVWAMREGRLANSTNAILLAAAAMLSINPLLLRYDAGFQLSFLATLGIVYLSPLLENFFWRRGKVPKLIHETIILTLAATVFVLPVLLNSFEKLPVISLAANLMILPAIPVIMGMGFAAGMAGFVNAALGKLVGFLPYILLKIELAVVQWLASLSWASVKIKSFGWVWMAVYYIFLFLVIKHASYRRQELYQNRVYEDMDDSPK